MAKADRTALRTDDWPASIDPKITARGPTHCYHALTIRITHRGHLRLLRSRPAQRLICLILALAGLQLYLLHSEYYGALAAKYSPTLFTRLPLQDKDLIGSTRWQVDTDDQNRGRQQLLFSRDQWTRLGSGGEGDTFSFNNSVIKVFKPGRSPLRNCVPYTASELRWPPEVPVSLLLGGLSNLDAAISDYTDFLPVYDYFLLPNGNSTPGQWYLVTPFVKTGTLEHLASRLQNQNRSHTAEDVDARYRPSFNRLLKALSIMHFEHKLCHDDIKMDNIFATDSAQPSGNTTSPAEAHWLLADLGNARQTNHSYHTSLLWAHDNGQNTDCCINDVVRLLKSYLFFLQSATTARDSGKHFNKAFLAASAPWSRLYWYTVNSAHGYLDGATAARQILQTSTGVFAPDETFVKPEPRQSFVQAMSTYSEEDDWESLSQPRLRRTSWSERIWPDSDGSTQESALVTQHLRMGMSASERWARIYGTLGILPIPSGQC